MHCMWTGIRILVPPGRSVVVGRHPDCDFVLKSPNVQRRVFRLLNGNGRLVVEDLHARHQIIVNGVPVPKGAVQDIFDGDHVTFGDYCFVVESVAGPPT